MKFVDVAEINVTAGPGGDGCVAFRREKGVPRGGPSGGNGGRGGSIWLAATDETSTLLDFRYRRHYKAGAGKAGGGNRRTGADGETVVAKKVSADDEHFSLEGVAEGFEPRSAWTVDSLANALESLDLEAVAPATEIDWNGATLYRVVTADGLDLAARVVGRQGEEGEDAEYWLALEAGLYTTSLDQAVDDAGREAAAERAEAINRRVSGWAYRIPKFNHDAMNKRMDDLVQEVSGEE